MKSRRLRKGIKRKSLRNKKTFKNKKSRRVRKSKVLYGGETKTYPWGVYYGDLGYKDPKSTELGPKIYPHGQGTMKYTNGDVYTGNFTHGIPEGQGKMTYADGNVYEGNFWGKPHGQGIMTYANGSTHEGTWYLNEKYGQGETIYADGSKSSGSYNEGKDGPFRVMSKPK